MESPRPWTAPTDSPPTGRARRPASDLRVPTGVADFDYLSGGIPTGSVVLLWGEAGAGHEEFALTSAAHLMLYQEDPEEHEFHTGASEGPFFHPQRVVYLSTSRSKEHRVREIEASFDEPYRSVLSRRLAFHDLSPSYFSDSVVPTSWASPPTPLLGGTLVPPGGGGGPLAEVTGLIEAEGAENLVILDSLTDLVVRRNSDPAQLLALVKGIRRRAKSLGGLVYLLLTRGVAPPSVEVALADSVDGVLAFGWQASPRHSFRQRTMAIEKFLPVLAHLTEQQQGRFVIRVSDRSGLVTTQYERV